MYRFVATKNVIRYLRWGRDAGCSFLAGIPEDFGTRTPPTVAPSRSRRVLSQSPRHDGSGHIRGSAGAAHSSNDDNTHDFRSLMEVSEVAANASLWEPYLCAVAFPEEAAEELSAIEEVSQFFEDIVTTEPSAYGYCTSDNRMTVSEHACFTFFHFFLSSFFSALFHFLSASCCNACIGARACTHWKRVYKRELIACYRRNLSLIHI